MASLMACSRSAFCEATKMPPEGGREGGVGAKVVKRFSLFERLKTMQVLGRSVRVCAGLLCR